MESLQSSDSSISVMSHLLDCSHEVLHNILAFCQPADLGALSRSCRSLHNFVVDNPVLCKELYLQKFDTPEDIANINWESRLRDLIRLDRLLASKDEEYKRNSLPFAADTICSLLSGSEPSKNTDFLLSHFKSRSNIDTLLTSSSLYEHAGTLAQHPAATPDLRQLSAKLHVYYGIPVDLDRANPPILAARSTTGPSYQVRHPYGTQLFDEECHYGAHGHHTRSKVRIVTPASFIARAKVYDLREYTAKTLWGPFKDDGSLEVDWEKMEAIMILISHNLRSCRMRRPGQTLWYGPWEGLGAGSFPSRHEESTHVPKVPDAEDNRTEQEKARDEEQDRLDKEDPYGISGTWLRVVCFLDYNDLYAFNFTGDHRREHRERGLASDEAIRLICLKLKVNRIVYPKVRGGRSSGSNEEDSDSSSDFDDDDTFLRARTAAMSGLTTSSSPTTVPQDSPMQSSTTAKPTPNPYAQMPIVYFTGTSRSLHTNWDPNANSRIRGCVRTTPHGAVRWTTFSIFHGEERWRSETVQVGGPKSARGALGNWFDKDYDHYGPAGPTAFWKVSNDSTLHNESVMPGGVVGVQEFMDFIAGSGSESSSDDEEEEGEEMEVVQVLDDMVEELREELEGDDEEEELEEARRALRAELEELRREQEEVDGLVAGQ